MKDKWLQVRVSDDKRKNIHKAAKIIGNPASEITERYWDKLIFKHLKIKY